MNNVMPHRSSPRIKVASLILDLGKSTRNTSGHLGSFLQVPSESPLGTSIKSEYRGNPSKVHVGHGACHIQILVGALRDPGENGEAFSGPRSSH